MIAPMSRRYMYLSAILLLTIVSANLVESQFAEYIQSNQCVSKQNCHDCIQTESCAWCLQPDYGDKPRCFKPTLSPGGCPEEFVWIPDNEERLITNKKLTIKNELSQEDSHPNVEESENIVQIYPQRVQLALKISMYFSFDFRM